MDTGIFALGPCARCGRDPAVGFATLEGSWYCDPDEGQSCYVDAIVESAEVSSEIAAWVTHTRGRVVKPT